MNIEHQLKNDEVYGYFKNQRSVFDIQNSRELNDEGVLVATLGQAGATINYS